MTTIQSNEALFSAEIVTVSVTASVAVSVATSVAVAVAVIVGNSVGVTVAVDATVIVSEDVCVGVGVGEGDAVAVGSGSGVIVAEGATVGVCVGTGVGGALVTLSNDGAGVVIFAAVADLTEDGFVAVASTVIEFAGSASTMRTQTVPARQVASHVNRTKAQIKPATTPVVIDNKNFSSSGILLLQPNQELLSRTHDAKTVYQPLSLIGMVRTIVA